jgi:hypothetical protein
MMMLSCFTSNLDHKCTHFCNKLFSSLLMLNTTFIRELLRKVVSKQTNVVSGRYVRNDVY